MIDSLIAYIRYVFSFDPDSPLLFTHLQFWVFFAFVFAGFAFLVGSLRRRNPSGNPMHLPGWRRLLRNGYLFLVSLLFYYKTSGLFVGLLILVTCTDFLLAQGIHHFRMSANRQETEGRKVSFWARFMPRLLLALSVTIDLGILCYFKY